MNKKIIVYVAAAVAAFSISFGSCRKSDSNQPPTCSIASPAKDAQFTTAESITVEVTAEDKDGTVAEVQLYVDNAVNSAKTAAPYTFTINAGLSAGAHTLKAVAKDDKGATAEASVSITVTTALSITGFSPTHAYEGETVTINGTGFTVSTTVSFNGTAVKTITNATATLLQVAVPEGATTGKIQVADNGKTAASASNFTVDLRLSAQATVTTLGNILATNPVDEDNIRMAYVGGALYITGPNQKTVYKMDVSTGNATTYINSATLGCNPIGITAMGNVNDPSMMLLSGTPSSGNNYFFLWAAGVVSNSSTVLHAKSYSLKRLSSGYIAADYDNRIISISSAAYYSNNSSSTITDAVINLQLIYSPKKANTSLGVDASGTVFAFANHTLWKLQPSNNLLWIAGQGDNEQSGYKDGPAATALFQDGGAGRANSIAVDDKDNVYVADKGSNTIRKVDVNGNVTTVAGNPLLTGNVPTFGRGDKMKFLAIGDICFGANYKTLYVIGMNNVGVINQPWWVFKVEFQ